MSVLVCGGAGYIGSHTVAELLDKNYSVVVIDSLEKGHKNAVLPGAKFYQGNISDSVFMDKVFSENKISSVIDFAAYSLVGESVDLPLKYYENNVNGTIALLKSMLNNNVKNIVFSSTAAVYGEPTSIPILESDSTIPTNPYGETKLAVEKILKWFGNAYGLNYAVLRYFNVAGAHKSGKIGEDHKPETHIIPIVLQAALGVRDKVQIYGDDYPTPDGTCIRDYIHVTDLSCAHILALEKIKKTNVSVTYNLGNGKGFSVKEIIETAKRVTGIDIKVEIEKRRKGDPSILVASSDKITSELGFEPKFNALDTIINSAWEWHKNNPDGYDD